MIIYETRDLYDIALNRLRKDKKGSISPEEFESLINNSSIDYFNQQLQVEGSTKRNNASLFPFLVWHEIEEIDTDAGEAYVDLSNLGKAWAQIVNLWYSTSDTDLSTLVEIDLISPTELSDRLNNAITAPSATNPVAVIHSTPGAVPLRPGNTEPYVKLYGISTNYLVVDYYRMPTNYYQDYYADTNGNLTLMYEAQYDADDLYTLQAGEVSRSGSTAPTQIVSVTKDLEWSDQDAMNILDMAMTSLGVALGDQAVAETSILERKQNVKS